MNPTRALDVARAQWRAAEERLLPTLIADPAAAARAVDAVHLLLAELRRHGDDPAALVAAAADPDALAAAAPLRGAGLPGELLVGVACGVRLRELQVILAEQDHRRTERLLQRARAAGLTWVVLDGPDEPAALTEGRTVVVHVESETVLVATVDPWTDDRPYELQVHPRGGTPLTRRFTGRAEWLDEHRLCRRDVETLHGPTHAAMTRTGAR